VIAPDNKVCAWVQIDLIDARRRRPKPVDLGDARPTRAQIVPAPAAAAAAAPRSS